MHSHTERILSDLQDLTMELEKLLVQSTSGVASHAEEAVASWRGTLKSAQDRLTELQEQTRRRIADGTKTARHAVEGNPWRSVAVAAAAGLLLGLALGGRDEGPPS